MDYKLKLRTKIAKVIKKKYVDFPNLLHEKNENGTSSDLVIDEIVWLTIKEIASKRY